jgi:proteasome lid subunit RPN8/RPN11
MSESSESHVRLLPPTDTTPLRSSVPTRCARLWLPPFEDELKPLVSVFVTSEAFVRFCAHGGKDLDNEVGGGLVGKWRVDEESGEQFVVVEAVPQARFTRQGSAFLTFTQDTLVAMNDELEERYQDKQLVGWYHTHPHMSVFLSQYDVWLHEHFFPEPWQVALVIEPHETTGGFFIRQESGEIDPHRYFGFCELIPDGKSSVVHWTNMRAVPEIPDTVGEGDE